MLFQARTLTEMMDSQTVRVALPVPLPRLFDYLVPESIDALSAGDRVLVPFGSRELVGIVVQPDARSSLPRDALKSVGALLGPNEIPDELLNLLLWTVRYYASPIGELVTLGLPPALRRKQPFKLPAAEWLQLTEQGRESTFSRAPKRQSLQQALVARSPRSRSELLDEGVSAHLLRSMLQAGLIEPADRPASPARTGPELNEEQKSAVDAITESINRFTAYLLAGVTGSGKTEVYLQAARPLVQRGQQVLFLLPEIGLTTQTVRRIEQRLGQPAWIYHSDLSEGERLATWQAARSGRARVLIGTRSALFLPLKTAAMIVVDEEHDSSYKQFDGVRYNARDGAVMRARALDIPIVLGSATPALESVANADQGRYRLLELTKRVTDLALPQWRLEDTRGDHSEAGLTPALIERIRDRIDAGEQVLVYRNRRGYAPILMCNECGWQADCNHCSAHLTMHHSSRTLRCHHCGYVQALPSRCPSCHAPDLHAGGSGTERVEERLARLIPKAPLIRVDRDQVQQRDQFEKIIDQLSAGQPCIIIGTQMIAKGHHWPGIGLAIVLDADQSLFSADFRGPERLAQTLYQVSGRAGRARPGEFVLQTRQPDHPFIQRLMETDYLSSARWLLDERAAAGLPPVTALAMVRAEARQATQAQAFLKRIAADLATSQVQVSGPLPALLQRRAGYWRYQLWLTSASRADLMAVTQRLPEHISQGKAPSNLRWHIDVDPLEV